MKADIYKCSCGYGWDKSKVVRHHFCPNCGRAVDSTELEPCTDAISRQAVLEAIEDDNRNAHYSCFASNYDAQCFKDIIKELPPVTPQYTEAEIQKMQDLEFAEIQKAYEIGKAENIDVLNKIREEFISLYPKNYTGELELGGAGCVFSLHQVLNIIDKYKASPTGEEVEE